MVESSRDMCVLVRNIVESVCVQGRGCQVDVAADASCCTPIPRCQCRGECACASFISATAGPGVTLVDAEIEPARGRPLFCVRAKLLVPVTVLTRRGGQNCVDRGQILIPVEGTMRAGGAASPYPELVAQANVRVCRGVYSDGCVRLWVDYQAELHAICLQKVRIPVMGPCNTCAPSCHPFFNLPLYPGDCGRT